LRDGEGGGESRAALSTDVAGELISRRALAREGLLGTSLLEMPCLRGLRRPPGVVLPAEAGEETMRCRLAACPP
jgi:hypothetical protein